jgi:hypothetical protein
MGMRVLKLGVAFGDDSRPIQMMHYAVPDDGRDMDNITLGELRPMPVLDADEFLVRCSRAPSDGRGE